MIVSVYGACVRDVMAHALYKFRTKLRACIQENLPERSYDPRAARRRVADNPTEDTPLAPSAHLTVTHTFCHSRQHDFLDFAQQSEQRVARALARHHERETPPCELCAVKRHFLENLSSDTTESESVCGLCACGKWLCGLCAVCALCVHGQHTHNTLAEHDHSHSRADTTHERVPTAPSRQRARCTKRRGKLTRDVHLTPTSRHGASCPRSASCLRLDSPPPPLSQPQPPPPPSPPLKPPPPPPAYLLPPHVYTALAFG